MEKTQQFSQLTRITQYIDEFNSKKSWTIKFFFKVESKKTRSLTRSMSEKSGTHTRLCRVFHDLCFKIIVVSG